MSKKIQISVLGGTGKAGKYIVTELLNQGFAVKMLARNPDSVGIKSDMLQVISGNARSHNSIQRLLAGSDAVVSALGNSGKEKDTCSTALGHVIKVMRDQNTDRYIEVAGIGIDTPEDKKGIRTKIVNRVLGFLFHAAIQDRRKGYTMLEESPLKWTIVRCPGIEPTAVKKPYKISLADIPGFKVNAATLASFISNELSEGLYIRKCPFIANEK